MKKIKHIITALLVIVAVAVPSATAYAMPTSALKLGSKGPEVKELQKKLAEINYLSEKYVTGFFGPKTKEAVINYQKDKAIDQTGVAAEKTLQSLFVSSNIDTTLVMHMEDESNNVKMLQKALFDLGYLTEDKITGYYGEATENAVKKFQKDNGISATGVAAKQTIEKINSLSNVVKLDETRNYKSGDEDEGVKALQKRLCQLGYLEQKYVTGYYGAITVSAVKKFQKSNQISQTGTVSTLTIAALNSQAAKINTESNDSSLTESIAKPGTLRFGDMGSQVKSLQSNLKKLGYFSGTPTGEFGNVTKESVIKFQKAYSLTADGIAGSKTLQKISAALSGKATATKSNGSSSPKSDSASSSSGVTVSGYSSANMDVVNNALETLSESQIEDCKLIARIVKREVGGSSYKCQLAVASVIMNRVARNGASVSAVIYAKNQFSTANSTLAVETYSTSNYYAALEAYMGVKPVGNCLYFCSASARNSCWAGKNRTYYTTLGTECFFL